VSAAIDGFKEFIRLSYSGTTTTQGALECADNTLSSYISPHSKLCVTINKHFNRNKPMNKHTCNFHCQLWSVVRPRWDILNLAQREHAVNDFAKDDVLPVEEIARCGRDEELQQKSGCER
jgi:hypothetical protein